MLKHLSRSGMDFWSLIPFSLPARPVFALEVYTRSNSVPFQSISDGFNKPRPESRTICATIDFSKAFDSVWHPALLHKFIRLASLLALLVGLNLSFLIGALAWFDKITKVIPFESVEVFREDWFLALYFFLFSLMISQLLCLLSSAALFMLTIWPFGPLRWRPHTKL